MSGKFGESKGRISVLLCPALVESTICPAPYHHHSSRALLLLLLRLQKVPKKGADPAHDVREKQLQKLATRGVVLLFNAVNKAQKQKREAEASGAKAPKGKAAAGKSGILAELKAKSAKVAAATAAGGEQLVPGSAAAAAAGAAAGAKQHQQQQQQYGGAGWEVLGEGFPGLTGGVKMKDWDKAAAGSDDDVNGQALAGSDDEDDSGGEGW
jgi:hypothetical protein